MIIDTPTLIHRGEIWEKSQCWPQEKNIVASIYQLLQQNNFQQVTQISDTRSIWQRQHRQVVVSLVDDIWDCAQDRSKDTPFLFDKHTQVITDNYVNCPTLYRLHCMPTTFYGIYSYEPTHIEWQPDRDYAFAVNRLDYKRMQILAEVYQTLRFGVGYVNFNCHLYRNSIDQQAKQKIFQEQAIINAGPSGVEKVYTDLAGMMPLRNYDCQHDEIFTRSWLSVVVETYSSDSVISFSEKMFRCLVTPVPWIVYAGRYAVARLRQLGFDVLDDVVDHSYDKLMEMQHKIPNVILAAQRTIATCKRRDWDEIKSRCKSAALHNQQLLAVFSQQWQQQAPVWFDQLARDLA